MVEYPKRVGQGYDHVLKNNLSYKARGREIAYIDTALNTLANNSFDLCLTLTDDDFVSLDMDLLTAPRKPDGSLPDIDFMRPAQGSNIIDAGVDIGFEFLGEAPELGAFEEQGKHENHNKRGRKDPYGLREDRSLKDEKRPPVSKRGQGKRIFPPPIHGPALEQNGTGNGDDDHG